MRAPMISALSLVAAAAGFSGCMPPTTQVNGFKITEVSWGAAQTDVATRAEFDMKCPKDQLQLKLLAVNDQFYYATQMGVTGCGQSVVYVDTPSGWVANAMSEAKPGQTQTTAANASH
jgi:hypothetical protein